MTITLSFETKIEEERYHALRDGKVWAQLNAEKERIEVWWPSVLDRDQAMQTKLKSIGGKGITNGGGWVALSITNCRQLRRKFGNRLEIHDDLDEWAFAEIERLEAIENLSSASSDAELSPHFAAEAPAIARVMHPYQRAGVAFLARTGRALLADQPGLGKASPISEPVLTPSGWVKMGDIRVGDKVVGSDGRPTEVLGVFPQGPREVVEVTFSDGTVVRCDWDHLWQVRTKDHRKAGLPGWTRTARELKEMGLYIENGARKRFDIPMVAPVQFDAEPYPLDAYTVGVLIGDGSMSQRHGVWITTDHEIVQGMSLPKPASLTRDEGTYGDYFLPGLSKILRDLGLSEKRAEQKSIPEPLLRGSVEDRISLLQGLLDTDGTTVSSRGSGVGTTIEYGTVSRRLSENVTELVQSLGGVVSVQEKWPAYTHKEEKRVGQLYYRMVLSLPTGITPFRLRRKLEKWVPRTKYEPHRSIVSIEGTGVYEEAQCIRVAAEDSLYVTKHYVVTHNTLQTIAAMVESGIEGDILVMAPTAAVAITWPDELKRWVPQDEVVQVMGPGPKRHDKLGSELQYEPIGKRRWFIVNLEMGRAQWIKPKRVFRRPKNDKSAPERWVTEPGWWSFSYPEFIQDFEFTNKIEEWVRDFDIDTGKYVRKKKVTKEVVHVPAPRWAALVVDESHRCLIAHTHHLQGCTQLRAGIAQIPVAENGLKIALSGTPMRGKPENLWGTLNWLYPERYSSYWAWAKQWFVVWGEDGKEEIEGLDESMASAFYKDIAPIMLRRTKREVRAELPDKLYAGTPLPDRNGDITEDSPVGHWLTMSPKQAKAYAEIRDLAETELDSGILVANGVLAELTRLKQFATCFGDIEQKVKSNGDIDYVFKPQLPSAKFDWIVEFLDDLGINKNSSMEPDEEEEVRKVVIASQFTSVLDLYDVELQKKGIKTLKITGKVSQGQRKLAAHQWQSEGGPRVFLLNTAAGGVSLTLDSADDLIFLDETWIPDDQEQVEDRIHRVSRLHQVTIHYLRTLETVEENIALVTGSRERTTKRLLDGERGVSFAKQLLTPIIRPR